MKTVKIIVTEPGKGREMNPYDRFRCQYIINSAQNYCSTNKSNCGCLAHKEFKASHPFRPAIDHNGHDLAPRSEAYECVEVKQWNAAEHNYPNDEWITIPYGDLLLYDWFPTRIAYQTIEDAVKEETTDTSPVEQVETVEEAAERLNEEMAPWSTTNWREGFIAGANWQRNQPPTAVSKEGRCIKEIAEEEYPINIFTYGPNGEFKTDVNYDARNIYIKGAEAYAAQHAQEGMVDVEKVISNDWTQQDLTFKVSELLEHSFDIKYARTDVLLNAYEIESSLHSIIDSLGLKLIIIDRDKFDCTLGDPLDI